MKIAVVAHIRHPIAEPFMGGMEAHCASLVRGLIAHGHEVTLFASGDSDDPGDLHPIAPTAYEAELPWARWHGSEALADWLWRAYANAWAAITKDGFDIVHNNSLFPELHDWAARDGIAMVTSLHVPPFQKLRDAIESNDVPWLRFTVTSQDQLGHWQGNSAPRTTVAYNGIDLARFAFASAGGERALWCGRITPNKGTIDAVRAAKAAGIALDVAGPIDCSDYFAALSPLLDAERCYVGHLSADAIADRMRRASFLVCTPCWDEPFGLVAAEALACGTPVIAYDRGALREVVGEAGILVQNESELADAMRRGMSIPRQYCRTRCEQLFSEQAMIARYRTAYDAAIAGLAAARASKIAMTRAELA